MDLICFDLDGTLLNKASEISPFTKETLMLLSDKDIAYTVATGRTMLSAKGIVEGHDFVLPHIYNNGVTVWDPKVDHVSFDNLLDSAEISVVIDMALMHGIAPFVNTIDKLDIPDSHQHTKSNNSQHTHHHCIFHAPTQHAVEKDLVNKYFAKTQAKLLPLSALPSNSKVTNISMIGEASVIKNIWLALNKHENLVAYSGPAIEGKQFSWMDVHHCRANKGSAVSNLKGQIGASNLICFGDSDNDLSMFALADESYAPQNATDEIKQSASAVIGHHHKDGIAHFLRERFSL
jgi:Cof subfamily protein (haloacid dehalogenase superfamily)